MATDSSSPGLSLCTGHDRRDFCACCQAVPLVMQAPGGLNCGATAKQKGRRRILRDAAGVSCAMVKKSLRDDMLNTALERIGLEPHIHLTRQTLKKPSWECLIGRRAR